MNKQQLIERFKKSRPSIFTSENDDILEECVNKYFSLPVNEDIDDKEVRRLCAVMTSFGYVTASSCVGHERKLPNIYFQDQDKGHVGILIVDILGSDCFAPVNDKWEVINCEKEIECVPGEHWCPWDYLLRPQNADFSISERYEKCVDDLDIIGVSLLLYNRLNI